jgi:hypothetical protein
MKTKTLEDSINNYLRNVKKIDGQYFGYCKVDNDYYITNLCSFIKVDSNVVDILPEMELKSDIEEVIKSMLGTFKLGTKSELSVASLFIDSIHGGNNKKCIYGNYYNIKYILEIMKILQLQTIEMTTNHKYILYFMKDNDVKAMISPTLDKDEFEEIFNTEEVKKGESEEEKCS